MQLHNLTHFPGITPILARPTNTVTLDANFAADKSLITAIGGLTFSFTRATPEGYFTSAGLYATAGSGTPAFGHLYNGTTWVSKGLSVFDGYTNLCLQSADMATTWAAGNGGVTIVVNTGTDPAGTTTADSIKRIDGANDHLLQAVTLAAASDYNFSFYVEQIDATTSALELFDVTGATVEGRMKITWSAGVPSLSDDAGTTAVTNMAVEDVSGGRYRVSGVFKSDAINTAHQIRVYPETTTAAAQGIFVWGGQLTLGKTLYPYIGTTTTSAVVDKSQVLSTNVNWYNVVEGALLVDFTPMGVGDGTIKSVVELSDNSVSDRISILLNAADKVDAVVDSISSEVAKLTSVASLVNNTTSTVGFSYRLNNFSASIDAATVLTDTAGTMPVGVSNINVGSRSDEASQGNCYIGRIRAYDVSQNPLWLTNNTA